MTDRVRAYLDGITERLAKISKTPWTAVVDDDWDYDTPIRSGHGEYLCTSPDDGVRGGHERHDAVFIAAAPSDVRALTGAVEAVLALADDLDAAGLGLTASDIRRAVAAHLDPKETER